MLWTRKQQAEQAKRIALSVHELHLNVTDLIAGSDLNDIEQKLRHLLKVLDVGTEG